MVYLQNESKPKLEESLNNRHLKGDTFIYTIHFIYTFNMYMVINGHRLTF